MDPITDTQDAPPAAPGNFNIGKQGTNALCKKAIDRRNAIQRNRAVFERQMLVNIAFLYGRQYFSVERGTTTPEERIVWELKSLERSKKTRRTVNYILPLYRTLLARMLQFKQQVTVDPETRQARDVAAARVSQEALEDFWRTVNRSNPVLCQEYAGMLNISSKLFQYMLILGKGTLKPIYNEKAKAKIVFPNMEGQPIMQAPVGAIEVEVDHAFNIFADPMRRYKIHKKVMSVDQVEELYNKRVAPTEIGLTDVEKQLMTLLEGGTDEKYTDATEFLEHWELPSAKSQEGELYICTEKEVLLEPRPLPGEYNGRLPFFDFSYIDILFGHPQGVIEQLIPSQEEYNHTVSRLHEYKKWMNGKILVPDTCQLHANYDDQVGQLIKYNAAGGKPQFDVPPGAPSFIMKEIDRIRRDMEDIASAHDNYNQRATGNGKSGQAIENLSELDNSTLSPQLIHIEQQMEFFCEMVLDMMQAKYSIPRLISIAGKDLTSDVKTFKGGDVSGNRRIKVSLGSTLPTNREARQTVIMGLAKEGFITKERAIELLEFGDLDGVYRSIDDGAEKTEIQELLKGIIIEPQPYENHARRIKILTDFMMGEEFISLRKKANEGSVETLQILNNFMEHRRKHQEFLAAEMAQMMPGNQPGQGETAPGATAAE